MAALNVIIVVVFLIGVVGLVCYQIGYEAGRKRYADMVKRYETARELLEKGDRTNSLLALTGDYTPGKQYRSKDF
jgi:hypothetical protein